MQGYTLFLSTIVFSLAARNSMSVGECGLSVLNMEMYHFAILDTVCLIRLVETDLL